MVGIVTRPEVSERVLVVVNDSFPDWDEEITATTTFVGDLEAEPIDFLDIKDRLEREFGIKIPSRELFFQTSYMPGPLEFMLSERMSVDDVVDYICGRLEL